MQNLLRIGTGLAAVLAIVSVHLFFELRAERALTGQLRMQIAESTSPAVAALPTKSPEVRRAEASAPASSASSNNTAAPVSAAPNSGINLNAQNAYYSEGDMMRDPEYRKARLTQARLQLKRNYTDVAEELGLTEREAEQLFDILAERQVGVNVPVSVGPDGRVDLQAMDEANRARRDAQRRLDESLQALLGPARQPKWQEYQLSLSARSRATSMSSMLASSGHPLTESQLRPLTAALIAEEKYVRDTQGTSNQRPTNTEAMARMQEESVNRQEESNRRYLEVAAAHMTAKQLALVKEVLEQQIALSRAGARLQRERLQSARPGVAVEPAVISYPN